MLRVNTSKRLMDAALELFRDKGFVKTTIGEIETAAGLKPRAGTFYRHYESKEALLKEIALTQLTETPGEFHFKNLTLLGDTRAELISIALKYQEAAARQKPYLKLFDELRALEFGAELEVQANRDMMAGLMDWVSKKPAAAGLKRKKLAVQALNVFGPLLFVLTKAQQNVTVEDLDETSFIKEWADFWSAQLDKSS
jgi:AcrR family transcriptional regulator